MSAEVLAYPFIFIAIFFEAFVLVTLLSKPAREARARTPGTATPRVAVIVPCYNEAGTVGGTVESLLMLDYPSDKLEIVLVNDGSTDGTREVMDRYAAHPQITVIHQANGGKHTALNAGIAATSAEFIGCLDADSFVDPAALREIIPCFDDPQVAATTGAMSIHKPQSLVQHMQNAEYTFGITTRHAIASVNGLYVTPGPFSFYRRSVLDELGSFRHGHQTEDMEMALRIQRAGYRIENAPRARVYTKGPHTIPALIKQRVRWTSGFLRNVLGDYRDLVFSYKHGTLGILILPTALLAVVSGITLFLFALTRMASDLITTIQIRSGVPLSYTLAPSLPSFDLFYFPTDLVLGLGMTTLGVSLALTVYGRYLSQTPMRLALGMISYVLLYSLVAPLWLIRATADVARGVERLWR